MASLSLLVNDYTALSKEAGRRHSEVRDAADKAAALVKSTSNPKDLLVQRQSGGPASLYDAVFLAPATKNPKVIALAVAVLQRLVTASLVPQGIAGSILDTLEAVVSQGVDCQLKVLQTLVTLLTTSVDREKLVQAENLGRALELAFRLSTSKIAVVSSTASATLRQLFMFIFERVEEEDELVKRSSDDPALEAKLPPASFSVDIPAPEYDAAAAPEQTNEQNTSSQSVKIRPAARDAYLLLEDLCLLVSGTGADGGPDGEPSFLKWTGLSKTFGLELVESIVSSFVPVVKSHPELVLVLRAHLCPLLIRFFSSPPTGTFSFPFTLRLMRVIFLLLKHFATDLPLEAEVFLTMFVRVIGPGDKGEGEGGHPAGPGNGSCPIWMRVLSLEICRGLCTDFDGLRRFFERYDQRKESSRIVYALLTSLNKLATEKPSVLGTGAAVLYGSSLGPAAKQDAASTSIVDSAMDIGFGLAQVAGTVVGSTASAAGLSTSTATMRVQCIDQLDKTDAPSIPETYPFLLALQSMCLIAEGFANRSIPLADHWKRNRETTRIDWSAAQDDKDLRVLRTLRTMVEVTWPAQLAALSFYVATALDEALFEETVNALENLTKVCGALELDTPREAFLTTLCKFAVPPSVVTELAIADPGATNRAKGVLAAGAETLGLTSAPLPTGLSGRNLICLKALIAASTYLAESLGPLWHNVFETLLHADFVLRTNAKKSRRSTNPSTPATPGRTAMTSSMTPATSASSPQKGSQPAESDEQVMQVSIAKFFDVSKALTDEAFTLFIEALCRLSRELVAANEAAPPLSRASTSDDGSRSSTSRAPSILAQIIKKEETAFPVQKIGVVALLNLHRLVYRTREVGWDAIVNHLLFVARSAQAPAPVRAQAADVLDQILVAAPKNISSSTEQVQKNVQSQILAALGEQTDPPSSRPQNQVDIEIRRMAYGTLLKILEVSGHSFKAGWTEAFRILRTACQPSALPSSPIATAAIDTIDEHSVSYFPSPSESKASRSAVLVRTSFPSLQLICTDLLDALSPDELRVCIETLAEFGRQGEDVNVALTAGGLLWSVSDHLQSKQSAQTGDDYSKLYMFLLLQLLTSASDDRQEVRDGSISTIFRSISLYGSTFTSDVWEQCMFEVVFPLIQSLSDEIQLHSSRTTVVSDVSKQQQPQIQPVLVSQPDGPPIELSAKQWDDSKVLALRSTGDAFSEYASAILGSPRAEAIWSDLVEHVKHSFSNDRPGPTTAALSAFERSLSASMSTASTNEKTVRFVQSEAWQAWLSMGSTIPELEKASSKKVLSQVNLEMFARCVESLYANSSDSFDLPRIQSLLATLKYVLTYSSSTDYRPDIDSLSATQERVLKVVSMIKLDVAGAPSAVLSDLSDYLSLAFVPRHRPVEHTNAKGAMMTNVALAKTVMPKVVEMFEQFETYVSIYIDGAVEKVLSALALPMKLKYDCPVPSKYGSDAPLWKTATIHFLRIVRRCFPILAKLKTELPSSTYEAVWRHIIEGYRGAVLADTDVDPPLSADARLEDENFDLALLISIEQDVLPHLGDKAVPAFLTKQLAGCLQRASRLYTLALRSRDDVDDAASQKEGVTSTPSQDVVQRASVDMVSTRSDSAYGSDVAGSSRDARFEESFDGQAHGEMRGTTADIVEVGRERFAYWSFDLLYLMCSEKTASRRTNCLALPSFVNRCAAVIKTYLADAPLRGKMPFPRIRQEELVYVLQKLNELELAEGAMYVSLSQDPTMEELPAVDTKLPFKQLLRSTMLRSRVAHLYELYPLLSSLLSLSTRMPSITSAFVPDHGYILGQAGTMNDLKGLPEGFAPRLVGGRQEGKRESDVVQLTLACLHKIGQEIGAGSTL